MKFRVPPLDETFLEDKQQQHEETRVRRSPRAWKPTQQILEFNRNFDGVKRTKKKVVRLRKGGATARLPSKKLWVTQETEDGKRRIIFGSDSKLDKQVEVLLPNIEKHINPSDFPSNHLADEEEYVEVREELKYGCVSEVEKRPVIASTNRLKSPTVSYLKEISEKTNTDVAEEDFLIKEELPENAREGPVLEIYVEVPRLPDLREKKAVNPSSWNFEQLVMELADRDQLLSPEQLRPLVDMQVDGDALLKSSLNDLVNVVGMQYSPAVRVRKIVRDLRRREDQEELG